MSLQVLVSFPGHISVDEFKKRIDILSGMGCQVHLDSSPIQERSKTMPKKGPFQIAEALTSNEESVIDQSMERSHRDGSSDLMDAMTVNAVGSLKPNMSREIISYYVENPGHTTAQAAGQLAEKFVAHYLDVNDAFSRIRNLINTMCHSNRNQRSLEKRGGRVGRGGAAQVYAIAA